MTKMIPTMRIRTREIPALVMWYLLVIDHLKHVFSNSRDAKLVC
jgi:hypothetical protein